MAAGDRAGHRAHRAFLGLVADRSERILLLALATSCLPPDGPLATGAPRRDAKPVASDGWRVVVGARLAAEARAIRPHAEEFRASLPDARLTARFSADGIAIDGERGEALALRTGAWGRSDAQVSVPARVPTLGACTAAEDATGACLRRLEYADDGLVEWWTSAGGGLEQGWSIADAPEGDGPLVLEVEVEGALAVEAADGEALLTDADGRAWSVGGLAAWDADGVVLPVRVEVRADTLVYRVEDAGAAYPVTVDPVYSTAAWTYDGNPTTDSFADAVAGAGDVNGDGYDDVIVGGAAYDGSTGRAYVYHGSSTGLATEAASTLTGETSSSNFGAAVAGAGDVNGDGYDDVIVGAYRYSTTTGRAYVFHGSATGVDETAATTLSAPVTSGYFGQAVSRAGDVNGDGYDDVIVGAWRYRTYTGRAYVYHGSASGVGTSAATTLSASGSAIAFGYAVADAGDVDGDGYDDVAVGAYYYDTYRGRVYVFHGSATGVGTTAVTTIDGPATWAEFGAAVDGAGDVDADGYADLAVGAVGYDSGAGRVYIYPGSAAGIATTASTELVGTPSIGLGASVADAGDVDADGFADIVVGAWGYDGNRGEAFVYHGSAAGLATSATTTIVGEAGFDELGRAVAGAGDVDGDGYDDVLAAAPGNEDEGRAYLHRGGAGGVDASAATAISGVAWSDDLGTAVADAGDVDGDGYADVLVGAPGAADNAGRVYVFQGGPSGFGTSADTTLTGAAVNDRFGVALAGAGDVNADGYADVIVGATGAGYFGEAYVFLGSASGLATTPATTLADGAISSRYGAAVAGAGDVDADGYDDVIVGDYWYSMTMGRAYVYHGGATGVRSTATTTISGTAGSGDELGTAVAGAGDVNGDGYADVVVGSPGYSTRQRGRVTIHLGSAGGVSSAPDTSIASSTDYAEFGYTVASADLNGDGYGDIVVGGYGDSLASGGVWVFNGSASGVGTAATATLTGASRSYFGFALDGDDLDGDGFDDLIVGSMGYGSYTGATYVYRGSATGLDTTAWWTVTGEGSGDQFGRAASSAGDVDGDGSADVIVGADAHENDGGRVYLYLGYVDDDGDGVVATEDCDDTDATVGAGTTRYLDADGDAYGGTAATACADDPAYVDVDGDCDDTDAGVSPAATEVCDAADTDEDCDGLADDADPDVTGATDWYVDADADGHGAALGTTACDAPSGEVADAADCDDGNAAIHPDAVEVCDAADTDEDCDGLADDMDADSTGRSLFYVDADGDGYGTGAVAWCELPAGHVALGGDCDDADPAFHPGAPESCSDPADYDCDGTVAYADADADGFAACDDCDDGAAAVNADAVELPADGVDQDCDGLEDCWLDLDGDGYRPDDTTISESDVTCGVSTPVLSGDCDDADASAFPGAVDTPADGLDQDCDGVDPSPTGGVDTGPGDTGGDSGSGAGDSGTDSGGSPGVDSGDTATGIPDTGIDTSGGVDTGTHPETGVETGDTGRETGEVDTGGVDTDTGDTSSETGGSETGDTETGGTDTHGDTGGPETGESETGESETGDSETDTPSETGERREDTGATAAPLEDEGCAGGCSTGGVGPGIGALLAAGVLFSRRRARP